MDFVEIKRRYVTTYCPVLEQYTLDVVNFIDYLLKKADIDYLTIDYRVKNAESFIDKIKRKSYKNPFSEIKDLAGIRIVAYYTDDVIKIADIISRHFVIESEHSEDKFNSLEIDEFGYRSFHLICRITEEREKIPEWEKYSNKPIEIQIRTISQHAWASISHKMDYKALIDVPKELRRKLFRLSALFELADEQLIELRDESFNLSEKYKKKIKRHEFDVPINSNTILEYLKEKKISDEWLLIARETELTEYQGDIYSDNSIQRLCATLNGLKVKSIIELDNLINKHKFEAVPIINKIFREIKQLGGQFTAVPNDLINIVIAKSEYLKFEGSFTWPEMWSKEVREVMNKNCHLIEPQDGI